MADRKRITLDDFKAFSDRMRHSHMPDPKERMFYHPAIGFAKLSKWMKWSKKSIQRYNEVHQNDTNNER